MHWLGVGAGALRQEGGTSVLLGHNVFCRSSAVDGGILIAQDHLDRRARLVLRAGSIPIEIPVSVQAGEPRIAGRDEAEPRNRPLAANQVGVEQLDQDRLVCLDRVNDIGAKLIVRVAESSLPHADVACGDVQVPRLKSEVLQRGMLGKGAG